MDRLIYINLFLNYISHSTTSNIDEQVIDNIVKPQQE